MTATVVIAGDDGVPERPGAGSFVDPLVGRLHAEYGVDPRAIRSLAAQVLETFAGARVQAFVPILVEKRVREICRSWGAGAGPGPAAVGDPQAALG